jgi:toxin ParE1/3/4
VGPVKVIWSRRFLRTLRFEYEYLRAIDPKMAGEVRGRLIAAAESLAQFPERGRRWRLRTARELVIPGLPYVLLYRMTRDGISVLAVFHTSRDWPWK